MRRPYLIVANRVANGRKCLAEQVFSLPWHGLLALRPDQSPTLGPDGWVQPAACCRAEKVISFWQDSS